MKLFPYILIRSGGLSFKIFQTFRWDWPGKMNDEYTLLQNYKQEKKLLLQLLNQLRKSTSDYQLKVYLSNVWKDINSNRNLRLNSVGTLFGDLSEIKTLLERLKAFQQNKFEIQNFHKDFNDWYEVQLQQDYLQLKRISQLPVFLNGLTMSSHSIYNRVLSLQKKEVAEFRKKEKQTARTLFQYFSRIGAKITPFSSFTQLSVFDINQKKNSIQKGESCFRLNALIFGYLKEVLCTHPAYFNYLELRLNPTLEKWETVFYFFLNSRNVESIQELESDEVLEYIWKIFQNTKPDFTFSKCLDQLGTIVDATVEALTAYLLHLIGLGFLEFKWTISGIDPEWDEKLIDQLENIERDELLNELLQLLNALREGLLELPQCDALGRKIIQQSADQKLRKFWEKVIAQKPIVPAKTEEILTKFQGGQYIFKPENIYFEDQSASNKWNIQQHDLEKGIQSIKLLLKTVQPLQEDLMSIRMVQCFLEKFSENDQIPFLDFYRYFAKWHAKNPEVKSDLFIKKQKAKWRKELKQIARKTDNFTVQFDLKDIQNIGDQISTNYTITDPRSYGVLIQLTQSQLPQIYLNTCFGGFGKMFGRFLSLFPKEILNAIRKRNMDLQQEEFWVENTDNSFFNANHHPPLLNSEIQLPESQNQLPESQQLPLKQILVNYDNASRSLQLIHKTTRQKVVLFDFGFESPDNRSPLFQFLSSFSLPDIDHLPLNNLINDIFQFTDSKKVIHYPKIQIGDNLILQRRRWYFPLPEICRKLTNETEADYLLRLMQWQSAWNLPNSVFYTIFPKDIDYSKMPTGNSGQPKKDDYKPQFLDFSIPLAVQLFGRTVNRTPFYLLIEAMFPNEAALITDERGNPYVTEMVVEFE